VAAERKAIEEEIAVEHHWRVGKRRGSRLDGRPGGWHRSRRAGRSAVEPPVRDPDAMRDPEEPAERG